MDTVDLQYFKNIIAEGRNNKDLLDSLSPNQFKAKESLIKHINSINILNSDSDVVILGSWYGSILIPAFYDKVKCITAIDLDDKVIRVAKNRIFKNYKKEKLDFITDDIFSEARFGKIKHSDLIINTSCEHMPAMNTLTALEESEAYFAFQSNNMYDIEGHTNCVGSLDEFKNQLPEHATVIIEEEIADTRGTRYMLVGKFN